MSDTEGMVSTESLKKSIRAYKWRLDADIKILESKLSKWKEREDDNFYQQIQDKWKDIDERFNKMDKVYLKLFVQLEEKSSEGKQFTDDWNEYVAKITELSDSIYTTVGKYSIDTHNSENEGAPTQTTGHQILAADIKPKELNMSYTSLEFKTWIENAMFFFNTCGIQNQSKLNQKTFYMNLVDGEIRSLVKLKTTEDSGFIDCIEATKETFLERYPVMIRRWNMKNLKQLKDESFFTFYSRFQESWMDAEMESIDPKELFHILLIDNITDEKLRSKLSSLDKINEEIIKIKAREHEKRKKMSDDYDKPNQRALKTKEQEKKFKGSCNKCTKFGHKGNDCRTKNLYCKNCKSKDHNTGARWCKKTKKPKKEGDKSRKTDTGDKSSSEETSDGDSSNTEDDTSHSKRTTTYERYVSRKIETEDTLTSDESDNVEENAVEEETVRLVKKQAETPYLNIGFIQNGEPKMDFNCVADTGSSKAIMAKNLWKKNNFTIDTSRNIKLFNANGKEMRVTGITYCSTYPKMINQRKNKNRKKTIQTEFIVSPDIHNEVLLSCTDLKRMGSISWRFPDVEIDESEGKHSSRKIESKEDNGLNQKQKKEIEKLLDEYEDILRDTIDDKKSIGEEADIHFKKDIEIKPFKCQTARCPPKAYQQTCEKKLQDLIDGGIIVEDDSPSAWVAAGHFVPKRSKDGQMRTRLVVDYRRLNSVIERPLRGFPSLQELRANVEKDSKFYFCCDLADGYHQVRLSEHASRYTTFIVSTGHGARTFRWLRCPQGMACSGDLFNERSDRAFSKLDGTMKLVDDVFCQAENWTTFMDRVKKIFENARKHNIYISRRKLQIGQKVFFAGFNVICDKEKGAIIKPDEGLLKSVREFPRPEKPRDIKSFQGLIQQVNSFNPDVSQSIVTLRQLLKKRCAWHLTKDMLDEFDAARAKFGSEYQELHPFDPKLKTGIFFDASKLKGLGWSLFQYEPDPKKGIRLIKCGSRSLIDAQKNYSVGELEMCAIFYGLRDLDYWIRGISFTGITDHFPLVGSWKKTLEEIESPRIKTMIEKCRIYDMDLQYLPGAWNLIADALSRLPTLRHFTEEELESHKEIEAHTANHTSYKDVSSDDTLEPFFDAAKDDIEYQKVVNAVEEGRNVNSLEEDHPGLLYKRQWDSLGIIHRKSDKMLILEGTKIVVPYRMRRMVLKQLHLAHLGYANTSETAKELYHWPSMLQDIRNVTETCEACITNNPSRMKEPMITMLEKPLNQIEPLEQVSIDLFHLNGKDYILMVDRASSKPWVRKLRSQRSEEIVEKLDYIFMDVGYPSILRSDGAKTFKGGFGRYLEDHKITHQVSSAYFAESNGQIERNVGKIKNVISRAIQSKEDVDLAIHAMCNTHIQGVGATPNELFYKRQIKCHLPQIKRKIQLSACMDRKEAKRQKQSKYAGRRKKFSKILEIGEKVKVQDEKSGKWCYKGIIKGIRDTGMSYDVEFCKPGDIPKTYLRNRKFLKEIKNVHHATVNENDITNENVDTNESTPGRKHGMKLRNKNVQGTKDQSKCTKHFCKHKDSSARSQHQGKQRCQGGQSERGRPTRKNTQ